MNFPATLKKVITNMFLVIFIAGLFGTKIYSIEQNVLVLNIHLQPKKTTQKCVSNIDGSQPLGYYEAILAWGDDHEINLHDIDVSKKSQEYIYDDGDGIPELDGNQFDSLVVNQISKNGEIKKI